MTEAVAVDQLRSIVERAERLTEERKSLSDDLAELYREARSNGLDVKTIKRVVAYRRKPLAEQQEADALFDMYLSALAGARTREAA